MAQPLGKDNMTSVQHRSGIICVFAQLNQGLCTALHNLLYFQHHFERCFCVACVAWQTHRDHVVRSHCRRRQQRCRRHTFRFRSIAFEGMYGFQSNLAELYIIIKYRSSLILVIICQILAELWPFFDLIFVVRFCSVTFEGMH